MARAGLARTSVTEAGATLADEIGFDQLSLGMVAERLGVKSPSLYNHIDSLAARPPTDPRGPRRDQQEGDWGTAMSERARLGRRVLSWQLTPRDQR